MCHSVESKLRKSRLSKRARRAVIFTQPKRELKKDLVEQILKRKRKEAIRKMVMRANENQEETLERKRKDAMRKMEKRANESQEESLERKIKNAARMNIRTNETLQLKLQRRKQNMQRMTIEIQLANDEEKKKLLARMTRKRMNELEEEKINKKKCS